MRALAVAVAGLGALTACGGPEAAETISASDGAGDLVESLGPEAFAALGCGLEAATRPCALIVAGGKRLLVGAPAGIGAGLPGGGPDLLDAVLLTELSANVIEGLDEVRNAGWMAGRRGPLLVAGPAGTHRVAAALNTAYEAADALAVVAHDPPGGFGAALLDGREAQGVWEVLDTGDLVVTAVAARGLATGFIVDYGGRSLLVAPCGGGLDAASAGADAALTCAGETGEGDIAWPQAREVALVEAP